MKNKCRRSALLSLLFGVAALVQSHTLKANHAWANYHWERSTNPVSLTLGSNLTRVHWTTYLGYSEADWDDGAQGYPYGDYLSLDIAAGSPKNLRRCAPNKGNIEICNGTYGFNGWLGIASISVEGDHIISASVRVNDSYHDLAPYNSAEWRWFVMCQEVGHVFGLGHQDENFDNANLGSCMDYTSDPSTNLHPNDHDFEQLQALYVNTDDASSGGGGSGGGGPSCKGGPKRCGSRGVSDLRSELELDSPGQWGRLISDHGPQETFELDLGQGRKIITHVLWTLERAREDHRDH